MGHIFDGGYYGNWDSMPESMRQMMQKYYQNVSSYWPFLGLMRFITWILIVMLLVALIRYFWLKGNKEK